RISENPEDRSRGGRSGISRQESLFAEAFRRRRAVRARSCMDDEHRKIAFQSSNSHDRNYQRWKIDLFLRAQNHRGRVCSFEPGQLKRRRFPLSFSVMTGVSPEKSPWSEKR